MIQDLLYTYIPWIYNRIYDLLHLGDRAVRALQTEFMIEKEWIFLKDIEIPIPSQLFPAQYPPEAIRWRCTAEPPRFSKGEGRLSHLDYLSFVVTTSEGQYDLTDWINDVKWAGPSEPTPCEIFLLWCCVRGEPHFKDLQTASVTFMNELGEETTKELKTQNHHTSNGIPHLHPDPSESDGPDPDRLMDAILSSSGC
jgi:hypothetical protein